MSKTVLITGASRGIGLALTKHYINANWKVIGAARNPETADQLRAAAPFKIVQLDTSDEVSVQNAATELEGIAIDVVINNAGIGAWSSFTKTTKDQLMQLFEVNTVGPFLVTRGFKQHLAQAAKERGLATVATVSSILGSIQATQSDAYTPYSVSKAAVNMLTACAAIDLKKDRITALTLHPGYVQTDMNNGVGHITPQESAKGIANVIENATLAKTGKYFD